MLRGRAVRSRGFAGLPDRLEPELRTALNLKSGRAISRVWGMPGVSWRRGSATDITTCEDNPCGPSSRDDPASPGLFDCASRHERLSGRLPGDQPLGPAAGISADDGGAAEPRPAGPLRRDAGELPVRRP